MYTEKNRRPALYYSTINAFFCADFLRSESRGAVLLYKEHLHLINSQVVIHNK
jgi:hypothetical protein